jgi:hypothetical protein
MAYTTIITGVDDFIPALNEMLLDACQNCAALVLLLFEPTLERDG